MKRQIRGLIPFIIFINFSYCQRINYFPSEWRSTQESDYYKESLSHLKENIPNHIEADFNGDDFKDHAWLLKKTNDDTIGLFVFLGNKNKGYKTIKLLAYEMDAKYIYTGISKVQPGKYKTACGRGYWDCGPSEPEILELTNPSINLFQFEGTSSYFYWDSNKNKFIRVWMSD